jgi:tyrosine phenol-lyase
MAGGQPVSMANVKALRALCDRYGIRLYLDATRLAENAWFIQQREEGYADKPIAAIVKEFCSYTDGAWMSAKKDHLVNIGGWLAMNHEDLFEAAATWWWSTKGCTPTAAWPAATWRRWPSASRRRCRTTTCSRIGQVLYLGELLTDWGIPIVQPVGGHAIFLDAKAIYPHVPQIASRRRRWPRSFIWTPASAHGARRRQRGPRPGHRRPPLPQAGTGAAHDPAPRLHAGAHGRCRRVGQGGLRRAGEGARAEMVYEPKYLRFFQARGLLLRECARFASSAVCFD